MFSRTKCVTPHNEVILRNKVAWAVRWRHGVDEVILRNKVAWAVRWRHGVDDRNQLTLTSRRFFPVFVQVVLKCVHCSAAYHFAYQIVSKSIGRLMCRNILQWVLLHCSLFCHWGHNRRASCTFSGESVEVLKYFTKSSSQSSLYRAGEFRVIEPFLTKLFLLRFAAHVLFYQCLVLSAGIPTALHIRDVDALGICIMGG